MPTKQTTGFDVFLGDKENITPSELMSEIIKVDSDIRGNRYRRISIDEVDSYVEPKSVDELLKDNVV